MVESIIVALIGGAMSIIGVLIANDKNRAAMDAKLDKQQAITDTKLEALTREVRQHNSALQDVPVIKEQIKVINHRLDDLERGA